MLIRDDVFGVPGGRRVAQAFTGRVIFLGDDLARFVNQMDKGGVVEIRLASGLPVQLERQR